MKARHLMKFVGGPADGRTEWHDGIPKVWTVPVVRSLPTNWFTMTSREQLEWTAESPIKLFRYRAQPGFTRIEEETNTYHHRMVSANLFGPCGEVPDPSVN